jgi:hypothetical protein
LTTALASAHVQARQLEPSPKNPALHVHTTGSDTVPRALQSPPDFVAWTWQTLQGEHAPPSP